MIACVVMGEFFILVTAHSIITGEIHAKGGRRLKRSDSPVLFWVMISIYFLVGLFMIVPSSMRLINFGMDDSSSETREKVKNFEQRHRDINDRKR